ncbi:MAG: hypothetical protein JWO77_1383 [Ilumatobacteraceae bacterium]|nr:hypothetical protein [Ilumatobacteraceae bacterium]
MSGSGAGRKRSRLRMGAVACSVLLVAACGTGAAAEPRAAAKAEVEAAVADAYLYVPIDGGRAVARWNGQAAGYTLAKARAVLPGRFDSAGGGAFVYRAGSAPDGVLRIRDVDGTVKVSMRAETVNGHFEPVTGDFDGNGFTDILWYQASGGTSYLWRFRADGSHASRVFPVAIDERYGNQVQAIDVNTDGITDLVVHGSRDVWIMAADGTHVQRRLGLDGDPGLTSLVAGSIGPDDGVTRRRMVAVYEGSLERLLTFNAAGQSTSKQLRAHQGSCCDYQPAVGGHFRTGYATTLFFHARTGEGTEYLQDLSAGGSIVTSPAPQIGGAYDTSVGDFDANGFDDLLLSNRNGATYLFSSDGSAFTKTDPANIPTRSLVVAVPMS